MNVDMAKRLADRRRQAGLTQEGLAEKLNVTRQAVSKWERSESSPDTDNLIALAELYGVSLDDLLYQDVALNKGAESGGGVEGNENYGREGEVEFVEAVLIEEDSEPAASGAAAATGNNATNNNASNATNTGTTGDGASGNRSTSSENPGPEGAHFHTNDGNVHIGPDGIHVEDGKDYVHINWRDGVNVVDGKKGDKVHVGWDGIHVNDREFDNLQDANDFLGTSAASKNSSAFVRNWMRFPFPLLVIIAYILVGVFQGAWGLGLFLFATIPLYYMIGRLMASKRLGPFFGGLYPLASVCWFCFMAFVRNEPHPAWVIFLTIPLVEWFIVAFTHWWRRRKKGNETQSGNRTK